MTLLLPTRKLLLPDAIWGMNLFGSSKSGSGVSEGSGSSSSHSVEQGGDCGCCVGGIAPRFMLVELDDPVVTEEMTYNGKTYTCVLPAGAYILSQVSENENYCTYFLDLGFCPDDVENGVVFDQSLTFEACPWQTGDAGDSDYHAGRLVWAGAVGGPAHYWINWYGGILALPTDKWDCMEGQDLLEAGYRLHIASFGPAHIRGW